MSAEQVQALIRAVTGDPAVAQRFSAVESVDELVTIAGELGFAVTAEDLEAVRDTSGAPSESTAGSASEAMADSIALSDAELAGVAGGAASFFPTFCQTGMCPTWYQAQCRE